MEIRPCSSHPCLKNAECIQNFTDLTSECNFGEYFKGKNCEEKIDLCQNETCSSNGACYEI